MLTRKDFEFTAKLISKVSNRADKLVAYTDAVKRFKKSNPAFNQSIFRKACGL